VLIKLDRREEAHRIFKVLFYHNVDSHFYLSQLILTQPSANTTDIQYLQELAVKFPYSSPIKHQLLRSATNDKEFVPLLDSFLQESIRKGIPSLFNSIKDMYKTSWQVELIEKQLLSYVTHLEKKSFTAESGSEEPTCMLWALFALAQHHVTVFDLHNALHFVNRAIAHTPSLVEPHMLKARIYKAFPHHDYLI